MQALRRSSEPVTLSCYTTREGIVDNFGVRLTTTSNSQLPSQLLSLHYPTHAHTSDSRGTSSNFASSSLDLVSELGPDKPLVLPKSGTSSRRPPVARSNTRGCSLPGDVLRPMLLEYWGQRAETEADAAFKGVRRESGRQLDSAWWPPSTMLAIPSGAPRLIQALVDGARDGAG